MSPQPAHKQISLSRLAGLVALGLALACSQEVTTPFEGIVRLQIVSGGSQSGIVGKELARPLVVSATDSRGKALSDLVVNFRVTSGGGSVYAGSASTNNKGQAADYWTLGTIAGVSNTLEVRAVLPTGEKQVFAVFTATPVSGPATAMTVHKGENSQWKRAGTAVLTRPAVRITDQFGNPVVGFSVTFTPTAGAGAVTGGVAVTDAQGIATVGSWTLGAVPGSNALTATAPGVSGSPFVFPALGNDGSLYVTSPHKVSVFAEGATGDVSPTRIIVAQLEDPRGIAIDGSGRIHVANGGNNSITTYAPGAPFNAPPIRRIIGSSTGLNGLEGVATDAAGNLYVANRFSNSISVFAPNANGNVAPIRVIVGGNTGLSAPIGLAMDLNDNLHVVNQGEDGGVTCCGSVTVYASGANGNAVPVRSISGTAASLFTPMGIALSSTGGVVVSTWGDINQAVNPFVTIKSFAAGLQGNVPPTSTILGENVLFGPHGIAINLAGQIFVANSGADGVAIYAAGAFGAVQPMAVLGGANAALGSARYLTF